LQSLWLHASLRPRFIDIFVLPAAQLTHTQSKTHGAAPFPPALSWLQSEESKALANAPVNASHGLPRGLKAASRLLLMFFRQDAACFL